MRVCLLFLLRNEYDDSCTIALSLLAVAASTNYHGTACINDRGCKWSSCILYRYYCYYRSGSRRSLNSLDRFFERSTNFDDSQPKERERRIVWLSRYYIHARDGPIVLPTAAALAATVIRSAA
uniref:Secreted protein n=1 Tax=Trichogramma kaykai TaxID=54128 RepID=A0ABD2WGE3_9HYME